MIALVEGSDPTINESIESNYYSYYEGINLNENNFHVAFRISLDTIKVNEIDPRFVKFVAVLGN